MSATRVLIVDDVALNRELAAFVLGQAGFEVSTADSGDDALLQLARLAPQVVLMDIQMPGLDGLEVTRRIKADPALRHTVVLAFTAYAMKGDEARMLAAGCDGYIAKPIDVARFAATVQGFLDVQPRR